MKPESCCFAILWFFYACIKLVMLVSYSKNSHETLVMVVITEVC